MTQPLVSVLMTVYNREKYITTAIESVLAQSMDDFELIIVDDGSTDRSLEIARDYQSDSRVKVFINETNLGDFPNRNRAASHATGKYLKYVDSDDAIYPHCLEVMTHMMEKHPQAGMLLCAWEETDSPYPFELSPLEAYRRCFVDGLRMSNAPATTMYRRNPFEQVEGFNTRWSLSADWELTLKMARHFPVVFAPTGLVFYRVHEGQIVAYMEDSYLNHFYQASAIALDALRHPECPLTSEEITWAKGRLLRSIVAYVTSLIVKRRRPLAATNYLRKMEVKPADWATLLSFRRPEVTRPDIGVEPNWSDYPRARTDRLNGASSAIRMDDGVSIVIAGKGSKADWELTIRSSLVQSEGHLEVIAVTAPGSSNPDPVVLSKYPCVRQVSCSVNDLWLAHNYAARQASGQFLKFVTPGTLLYPYAAEFGAHALKVNPEYNFTAWGQLSTMPYLTALSPETAIACDLADGWQVCRVDLANATVRKNAFLKAQGFDSTWGEWPAYELFFRLSLERGVIHGMFSSSNRETTIRPGSAADMPPSLRQHLERLMAAVPGWHSLGDGALELLANNAASLRQKALDGCTWDCSQYPWARPLRSLSQPSQPNAQRPRHDTPSASLSSGE